MEDRRKESRVDFVDTKVVVKGKRGTRIAKLHDVSLGSAKVQFTNELVPEVGDELGIFIFSRLDLTGTVVRIEELPDGEGWLAAIRFQTPPAATRNRLVDYLSLMLQYSQDGQRRHPRLRHRREITFRQGGGEQRASLHDISHGGLMMAIDAPITEGAIEVELEGGPRLRGQVVRQWNVDGSEKTCFVSVAFDDVSSGDSELLAKFLEQNL